MTEEVIINTPELWKSAYPLPSADKHKYHFGHTVIFGGGIECTGASKLAALSALHIGSGLVTIWSDKEALPIYASALTSVMAKPIYRKSHIKEALKDSHITAALIGPGYGVGHKTIEDAELILDTGKACVLDADALTSFKEDPHALFAHTHGKVVLTPHAGEFRALFEVSGNNIVDATVAAKTSRAVVVLKGSETVIATPDGEVVVNQEAPPWLATAGSGDVLAGMVAGLLARGMEPKDAACAAVWMHSEVARKLSIGMASEDMPEVIPVVLTSLFGRAFD